MITNEEFLEHLQQDYPNQDWENIPDLDSSPDVYAISGVSIRKDFKGVERKCGFTVFQEYASLEEAEAQVAYMRSAEAWQGLVEDSIVIKTKKPSDILHLNAMKDIKDMIEAGELTFPVFLP